jgi:hypothetical protein
VNSIPFILVDTPGFNDTFRDDREILKEITDWLASTYQQGQKITGVIYLHPINQPRMEGSALLNLTVMKKLCGSDTFENVILASTFWDLVDEASGIQRENQLCQKPQFWGGMKRNGSKVLRIKKYTHAPEILLQLAGKQEVTLDIQKEMVENHKQLQATAAAQALDHEVIKLEGEHKQQKKEMEERHKAELKHQEDSNKRNLARQRARQKSIQNLRTRLAKEQAHVEERLQRAEIEERNRVALQVEQEAERERQKLRAIQEQKRKLAEEERQMAAAHKERLAEEKKLREAWSRDLLSSRYRLELHSQIQNFQVAISRWAVMTRVYTFAGQTPLFMNWCDKCFDLVGFRGVYRKLWTISSLRNIAC